MSQGPSPSEFLTFYRRLITHPAIRQTVSHPAQTSARLRSYSTFHSAIQTAPVTSKTPIKVVEKLSPSSAKLQQPALFKSAGESFTKPYQSNH